MGNWQREIERFAPGTPVRRYHGTARNLEGLADGEFVLTTYGTMRLDALQLAELPARMGNGRRRRGTAREEPVLRDGTGAAHDSRPCTCRAHRHARGEQPVRAVGDPRLDHSRTARPAGHLPPTLRRVGGGRRPRECGAACPAGASVPAAPSQERPGHRTRTAAEDRDRPCRVAHPGTGRTVRGGRTRGARRDLRHRRLRPARTGRQAADRAEADLQPPRAVPQGGHPRARRTLRKAGAAGRAAGHDPRRGEPRWRAGLHAVRADGAPAGASSGRPRSAHAVPARGHARRTARGDGARLPGRRCAGVPAVAQGSGHGPESDAGRRMSSTTTAGGIPRSRRRPPTGRTASGRHSPCRSTG